jgi:quercetin dioxygenase-like cupin family protein
MGNTLFDIAFAGVIDGVQVRVLHRDESMIMTEFTFRKGAVLPEHSHQSSHSDYLLRGKIRLTTDETVRDFIQGDSWSMNRNIGHSIVALEDSVVLEVFAFEHTDLGFQVSTPANKIGI